MLSALFAYAQKPPINTLADVSIGARGLNIGPSLHLYPYYVYVTLVQIGKYFRHKIVNIF